MRYMNDYDMAVAAGRVGRDPVLGKAVRFLTAFRDEVDTHSDGWPYWAAPVRAAKALMVLVETGTPGLATEADLRKALAPIRAFYTRRGYAAGMRLPELV